MALTSNTTRYPPTDEVFFVQNAGAPAAGTGLNKSSIIQKISLAEADAVTSVRNATGNVTVTVVPSDPEVINPNGALDPCHRDNSVGQRANYLHRRYKLQGQHYLHR